MTSKLDLASIFQNIADELLIQVTRGNGLHSSKNIKASGKPFESGFRKFLKDGFPSSFGVHGGYFYGLDMAVSSEVDIIVSREEDSYKLVPAPIEDAYVPFVSLEMIGQLKNSSRDLEKALKQIDRNVKQFECMEQKSHLGTSGVRKPLTFIVCGRDKPKNLSNILLLKTLHCVDYVLLLEEGKIIANEGCQTFGGNDSLSFVDKEWRGGNYGVWGPDVSKVSIEKVQGVTLLWFYYALINKTNSAKKTQFHESFCNEIQHKFNLVRTIDYV